MSSLTPFAKLLITVSIFAIFTFIISDCMGCRYERDAADTLFQETKASTLLEKYEDFKDLLTLLDQKRANIMVFDAQIKEVQGDPTINSEDKADQLSLYRSERLGAITSYNMVAQEYNSRMAKANYAFCNVGDLPASNLKPLPRNVANYITDIKSE